MNAREEVQNCLDVIRLGNDPSFETERLGRIFTNLMNCLDNTEIDLVDQIKENINNNKELHGKLERNVKENTSLRKSLAGLNTTNLDLRKDISDIRDENTELHKTVNRYKSQQSNALDLRKDMNDSEADNTELRKLLSELADDNMKLSKALVKSEELVAQLHETVNDLNLGNSGLHNELVRTRERHDNLLDDNMKLSEEIDGLTTGENSLSLVELKSLIRYIRDARVPLPNLYLKLTSMVDELERPNAKEMTVEEIEKALGHSIKVVK